MPLLCIVWLYNQPYFKITAQNCTLTTRTCSNSLNVDKTEKVKDSKRKKGIILQLIVLLKLNWSMTYSITHINLSYIVASFSSALNSKSNLSFPGPLGSRAAKAIGFIDMMINYSLENAPLQKELYAGDSYSILHLLFLFKNP